MAWAILGGLHFMMLSKGFQLEPLVYIFCDFGVIGGAGAVEKFL